MHLSLNFITGPLSGKLVERKVNEYADLVMGLAAIFIPRIEVVVSNRDKQQCRRDITRVCRERLELMAREQNDNTQSDVTPRLAAGQQVGPRVFADPWRGSRRS